VTAGFRLTFTSLEREDLVDIDPRLLRGCLEHSSGKEDGKTKGWHVGHDNLEKICETVFFL